MANIFLIKKHSNSKWETIATCKTEKLANKLLKKLEDVTYAAGDRFTYYQIESIELFSKMPKMYCWRVRYRKSSKEIFAEPCEPRFEWKIALDAYNQPYTFGATKEEAIKHIEKFVNEILLKEK